MYTFVFLWTPALSPNEEEIPHGFIFATFMLASMLGSSVASRLLARASLKVESYMQIVFVISSASLLLPIVTNVCQFSNSYGIFFSGCWIFLAIFNLLLIWSRFCLNLPRWKAEASHLQVVSSFLASAHSRLVWGSSGRPSWRWGPSTFQRRLEALSWTSSAFPSISLCASCYIMYVTLMA